jgi:hypothetical protein
MLENQVEFVVLLYFCAFHSPVAGFSKLLKLNANTFHSQCYYVHAQERRVSRNSKVLFLRIGGLIQRSTSVSDGSRVSIQKILRS